MAPSTYPATLIIALSIVLANQLVSVPISASPRTDNPNRSLFAGMKIGAGLDVTTADRSPENIAGNHPEAYSLGAFLISVSVGYRINEYWGIAGEWSQAQHRAHQEWGNIARYTTGALAFRAALPLATRQTPVLEIGAVVGRFSYGASSRFEPENNDTLVVGPLAGLVLEHELLLGLVATFELVYQPLFRKGMNGRLLLEEVTYHMDGQVTSDIIGSKDFTQSTFVHLLWLRVGLNFEWTFR